MLANVRALVEVRNFMNNKAKRRFRVKWSRRNRQIVGECRSFTVLSLAKCGVPKFWAPFEANGKNACLERLFSRKRLEILDKI